MLLILGFSTLLVAVVTLLPLSRQSHWLVRVLDFPRLQIAFLAAAVLVAHLFFLDLDTPIGWVLISITILCLMHQLGWILPYTPLWPKEVKRCEAYDPVRQISVITANVLGSNRNSTALVKLVEQYQPDILVTQESNQWWEGRLKALEPDMPHSARCPLDNFYGMHVFSRLPIEEQEISYLVEKDVPSIHITLVLATGDKLRMHCLHPAPPSPTENRESAERDAELIVVARKIAGMSQPVIVAGDLNDVPWSATIRLFRKISGLLDPRVGRGMFNTFHANYPCLRWPLDHLFHSRHFTLHAIQRLPSTGSDHFALFTSLAFTPVRGKDQEGPKADSTDFDKAKEISADKPVTVSDVPQ